MDDTFDESDPVEPDAEVRPPAPPTVTKAEAEKGRWFDTSRPIALQLLRSRARRIEANRRGHG